MKIPKILTEDQQEDLLESFNTRYITPKRNKLLVKLMLNAGLRLAESLDLQWSHIDAERNIVDVRAGKGDKDRRLFLSSSFCSELALWRNKQKEWLEIETTPKYVFTTKNNTRINPRYVRAMMTRQCEKAGLDPSYHPHTLRHTFATDLYKQTKNIRMVQKALGHSDISTTMVYTHIVDDELKESMQALRGKQKVQPNQSK